MSYLLDKKIKQKKFSKIVLGIIVLLVLFFFRTGIFNSFSSITQVIFRPVLVAGNNIGGKFKSLGIYFVSKNSLYAENQDLRTKLDFNEARMTNYDSVVADANSLKEILGRKSTKIDMVLAGILERPNQSAYDTLLIDAGTEQGIKTGDTVFAKGNIPIGRVADIFSNSSKVILFSSAGEKTMAIVSGKDMTLELIGRGGGNFEMILPKDFTLQPREQVTLPGINAFVVAIAETMIFDPRDSFNKALLTSPVNVQQLKFVEIEPQK